MWKLFSILIQINSFLLQCFALKLIFYASSSSSSSSAAAAAALLLLEVIQKAISKFSHYIFSLIFSCQRNSVAMKGLAVELILQVSNSRKLKMVFKLMPPGVTCHWYIKCNVFLSCYQKDLDILASYQFAPGQVFWVYCKSVSYRNVPKAMDWRISLQRQSDTRKLENQRKSVSRKIRHRRKNPRSWRF